MFNTAGSLYWTVQKLKIITVQLGNKISLLSFIGEWMALQNNASQQPSLSKVIFEPCHEKTCLVLYANNKDADQLAHLCRGSLISTFVVCCLDSVISLISCVISLISLDSVSRLLLGCVAEQTGESYLVPNPEDRFSCDVAHLHLTTNTIIIFHDEMSVQKKFG